MDTNEITIVICSAIYLGQCGNVGLVSRTTPNTTTHWKLIVHQSVWRPSRTEKRREKKTHSTSGHFLCWLVWPCIEFVVVDIFGSVACISFVSCFIFRAVASVCNSSDAGVAVMVVVSGYFIFHDSVVIVQPHKTETRNKNNKPFLSLSLSCTHNITSFNVRHVSALLHPFRKFTRVAVLFPFDSCPTMYFSEGVWR